MQPTVYWKTARAQRLPFTLDLRVLYRGTGASIFNECQMMGLQFGLTGFFQRILTTEIHADKGWIHQFEPTQRLLICFDQHEELLSAGMGGCVASLFASPLELVMIQQQLHGLSAKHILTKIATKYGVRHMMRGVVAASIRDTIYVSGMLGVTPIIQWYLTEKYKFSFSSSCFYSSIIGGMIAALPSHPLDVSKTCMQGDLKQTEYTTLSSTFKLLWKQGGYQRLFAGCMWRTVNIIATVYVANQCMNHLHDHAKTLPF